MTFANKLAIESWALYGAAVVVYILRIFSRVYLYGWQRLQADDAVMTMVIIFYTILITCLNIIASGGGSNLYYESEYKTFTPEQIEERIQGSKIVLVSEQAMLCTIWGIKSCMLLFYRHLTTGLRARKVVQGVMLYVAVGFAACQLAMFLQCRPFQGYWALPPPKADCSTFFSYALVNMIFNISSDLMMMAIPLPLVYRSNLPTKQKIAVIIVFLMGTFVIIAAVLTKVFNLSDLHSTSYMLWYIRESSVAVYVSNLPLIWPLIRKVVPGMKSLSSSSGRSKYHANGHGSHNRLGTSGAPPPHDLEMSSSKSTITSHSHRSKKRIPDATLWEDNDSQEFLQPETPGALSLSGIRQDLTFTIVSEERKGWNEKDRKNGGVGVFGAESGDGVGRGEYHVDVQATAAPGHGHHRRESSG